MIDSRAGTIISATPFEKARNPSYQLLESAFGDLGIDHLLLRLQACTKKKN
ncbi:hypothetical protein [Epilithonimonas tenax]|uniref:hypothetical protein n=1 Tax=Epilithonimonas tenax TaxID=191577 RepID=UPI00041A0D0E|nr:hypothetical protein [Epilithonimonas tenax]